MSDILYDAESGRLRLDRAAFDRLVAWAAGRLAEAPPGLRAAGLVDEHERLHPYLSDRVDAIVDPVCRVIIRTQDANGRQRSHDGWVAGTAASLLLAHNGGDDRCELAGLHPTFLPEAVARLVGLGPRPRLTDVVPVLLSPTVLDDLTDPDPERRAAASDWLRSTAPGATEQTAAEALGTRILSRWEAVVTWDAQRRRSPGRRGLHVIDTPAGLWLVEPVGSNLLASPTTPSVVWRLLTTLLPRDDELDFPSGGRQAERPTLDGV
jgi:hypothetical protein